MIYKNQNCSKKNLRLENKMIKLNQDDNRFLSFSFSDRKRYFLVTCNEIDISRQNIA